MSSTQRRSDLCRVFLDGQGGAPIGIRNEVVGVDDQQPVGAPHQLLDATRGRRRADLDDEIGVVALTKAGIGGEQRAG